MSHSSVTRSKRRGCSQRMDTPTGPIMKTGSNLDSASVCLCDVSYHLCRVEPSPAETRLVSSVSTSCLNHWSLIIAEQVAEFTSRFVRVCVCRVVVVGGCKREDTVVSVAYRKSNTRHRAVSPVHVRAPAAGSAVASSRAATSKRSSVSTRDRSCSILAT